MRTDKMKAKGIADDEELFAKDATHSIDLELYSGCNEQGGEESEFVKSRLEKRALAFQHSCEIKRQSESLGFQVLN